MLKWLLNDIFSSPGRSPGRAIVLPPVSASALVAASALAKCLKFYIKVFYVMGKALSGELSCPCDRSCFFFYRNQYSNSNAFKLQHMKCIEVKGIFEKVDQYFAQKCSFLTQNY